MKLTEGKIRVTDLARKLKTTPANIRLHLKNKSPLGGDEVKFADRQTGDLLIPIVNVLNFLQWLRSKGRKVKHEDIDKTEAEVMSLWKVLS